MSRISYSLEERVDDTKVESEVQTIQWPNKGESEVQTIQWPSKGESEVQTIKWPNKGESEVQTIQWPNEGESEVQTIQWPNKEESEVQTIKWPSKGESEVQTIQWPNKEESEVQTMQWPNEKGQTDIQTLYIRKLKIEQHKPHWKPVENAGAKVWFICRENVFTPLRSLYSSTWRRDATTERKCSAVTRTWEEDHSFSDFYKAKKHQQTWVLVNLRKTCHK